MNSLQKSVPNWIKKFQSKKPGGCRIYLNSNFKLFFISPTNPQEISDLINSLDDSKESGPCSVPVKMLKLARHKLSIPRNDICNTSFNDGISPGKMKVA